MSSLPHTEDVFKFASSLTLAIRFFIAIASILFWSSFLLLRHKCLVNSSTRYYSIHFLLVYLSKEYSFAMHFEGVKPCSRSLDFSRLDIENYKNFEEEERKKERVRKEGKREKKKNASLT
jgi:hypothetical protein